MLGLTSYFSRLRAARAALMPSVAVALGLMGVSPATADDGAARGSSSRTGTVLRYRIDVAQFRNRWLQSIQTDARRILKDGKIGHDGARIAENQVRVTLRDAGKMDQAVRRLKTLAVPSTSWLFRTSYDLTVSPGENGLIVIEPTPEGLRTREESTLPRSMEVVRHRVDPEGNAGASVTAEGKDGITVQFAGLDAAEVKARIASSAMMTFQLVDDSMSPEVAQANGIPPGDELLPDGEHPDRLLLLYKEAAVTSGDLQEASASLDEVHRLTINFELSVRGTAAFARVTSENIGKRFAIVLGGKVFSAPVVRSEIPGGHGQITGHFSAAEASRMSLLLRSGALPVPLSLVEERTIELTGRRRE